MISGRALREARKAAGLTQAELARRLGTTQPEIARIESVRSNPRIATLNRAIRATGHRLEASLAPLGPQVDETLLAANLRVAPRERLKRFEEAYSGIARLASKAHGGSRRP